MEHSGSNPKTLAVFGVVAIGGFVLFLLSQGKNTSTSTGVDANAVAAQNAIVAANSNALTIGAQERVQLATIASSLAATHDSNQTTLAVAQTNGGTQEQLASIAAQSTYASSLMDAVKSIESTLSTAQTAQYHDYVTGQTALQNAMTATNIAGIQANSATTIASTQAAAATAIGMAQTSLGLAQTNASVAIAGTNANAQVSISQNQADAAKVASNNATTVAVNAADRAASASKSNGFWSSIASLAGSITGALTGTGGGGTPASSYSGPSSANSSYGTWGGLMATRSTMIVGRSVNVPAGGTNTAVASPYVAPTVVVDGVVTGGPTNYAATATGWTNAQLADIQAAVRAGVAGVGGGETVGQIVQTSQAYLTKTGDFTAAQIAAIGTAEAWDPHGLAFREQGSDSTPFYTAAYQAILSGFSGAYGTPQAAVQPPIVTPSTPTPAPTPAPAAAPAVVVPATPAVTIAAPPAAISAPASASTAGAGTDSGLSAAIAALTTLTTTLAQASQPVAAAAATTTSASALQAAADAQTATTSATGTDATTTDLANAILANAQNANTAGSGSVAGGVAYPDTSGTTPLTATTRTTSGSSSAFLVAIVGLLAIGGLFVYLHFRHHGSAHATQ